MHLSAAEVPTDAMRAAASVTATGHSQQFKHLQKI